METIIRHAIKGVTFGARGCSSCSCDPCDCNPCNCGDSRTPSYPAWRISGCALTSGIVNGVDIAQYDVLSLTQPVEVGGHDAWSTVVLLPTQASSAQCGALLAAIAATLDSWPAEAGQRPSLRPFVYQSALDVQFTDDDSLLTVHFDPCVDRCLRTGDCAIPRAWTYTGKVALRSVFDTTR
jgi:hypothetical protein